MGDDRCRQRRDFQSTLPRFETRCSSQCPAFPYGDRPRGAPQSLEETLEILGASQLSIDNGRGERVVIDGRARQVDPPTSTFSKLLDRLGERLRK